MLQSVGSQSVGHNLWAEQQPSSSHLHYLIGKLCVYQRDLISSTEENRDV